MDEGKIRQLAGLLAGAGRTTFFGGAGMSTEAGIPDFRSAGGLYSRDTGLAATAEEVLSSGFLESHPREFYRFYRENLLHPEVSPGPAHRALAWLETAGYLTGVITQNIDGLHQLAGSRRVLELHGTVHENFCTSCGKTSDLEAMLTGDPVPVCPACGGTLRPRVVLYGEPLDPGIWLEAETLVRQADLLLVGGTSLAVWPAASLAESFRGTLVILNREPTPLDARAELVFREPAGQVLEAVVSLLDIGKTD